MCPPRPLAKGLVLDGAWMERSRGKRQKREWEHRKVEDACSWAWSARSKSRRWAPPLLRRVESIDELRRTSEVLLQSDPPASLLLSALLGRESSAETAKTVPPL